MYLNTYSVIPFGMVFAYAAVSAAQKPRQPPTGVRAVYLHLLTAAFICSINGAAPLVQLWRV
jgi:hypothetical protein